MTAPSFALRAGSKGLVVRLLQQRLGVTADGVCGPKTLDAARLALLNQRHLTRLGQVERNELARLGVDLRFGVDLSGHNEGGGKAPVDFGALAKVGVSLAWLKLTEGAAYANTEARRQVAAARSAGLLVGGYHFGDPSVDRRGLDLNALHEDARAEAEHYLETRASFFGRYLPELPDVLDLERGIGQRLGGKLMARTFGTSAERAAMTVRWCLVWLAWVEKATGRKPWVYTAQWAFDAYLRGASRDLLAELATYRLWVASYNAGTEPARLPAIWPEWSAWQFSGKGSVPGVDGRCDLNWLLGEDIA